MGVGVVELRLTFCRFDLDLIANSRCLTSSMYYVVWVFQTRALYSKASPGSRSRGAEA